MFRSMLRIGLNHLINQLLYEQPLNIHIKAQFADKSKQL